MRFCGAGILLSLLPLPEAKVADISVFSSQLSKWAAAKWSGGVDASFSYTPLITENKISVLEGFLKIGEHNRLNLNFRVVNSVKDLVLQLPKDIFESVFLQLSMKFKVYYDATAKVWELPNGARIDDLPSIVVEVAGLATLLEPKDYVYAADRTLLIKPLAGNTSTVILCAGFFKGDRVQMKFDTSKTMIGFKADPAVLVAPAPVTLVSQPSFRRKIWDTVSPLFTVSYNLCASIAGSVGANVRDTVLYPVTFMKELVFGRYDDDVKIPFVMLALEGISAIPYPAEVTSVDNDGLRIGGKISPENEKDYYGRVEAAYARNTRGRLNFVNSSKVVSWVDTLYYGDLKSQGVFSIAPRSGFCNAFKRFVVNARSRKDGSFPIEKIGSASSTGFHLVRVTADGVKAKQWRLPARVSVNSVARPIDTEVVIDFGLRSKVSLPKAIFESFAEWFKLRFMPKLDPINPFRTYWQIREFPTLTLSIGDYDIDITPDMYVEHKGWSKKILIEESSDSFARISFAAFSGRHSVFFDAEEMQVGFAKLNFSLMALLV